MSLGIVIKSPSGLVLAADSRVTLQVEKKPPAKGNGLTVHYDNATKVLRFGGSHNYVAAVTYGQAVIPGANRTAESFLPEFDAGLTQERLGVGEFAKRFTEFIATQWGDSLKDYKGQPMVFVFSGFDAGDPYGKVYTITVPGTGEPAEQHGSGFGATWGGQSEMVDRLVNGARAALKGRIEKELGLTPEQSNKLQEVLDGERTLIPFDMMALQDCVDLAVTLMGATVSMQQLAITLRGVGGPVDIVTITRTEGLRVVRFKEIGVPT